MFFNLFLIFWYHVGWSDTSLLSTMYIICNFHGFVEKKWSYHELGIFVVYSCFFCLSNYYQKTVLQIYYWPNCWLIMTKAILANILNSDFFNLANKTKRYSIILFTSLLLTIYMYLLSLVSSKSYTSNLYISNLKTLQDLYYVSMCLCVHVWAYVCLVFCYD